MGGGRKVICRELLPEGTIKMTQFFSFAWDFPRFFAGLFMRSLKYYIVIEYLNSMIVIIALNN